MGTAALILGKDNVRMIDSSGRKLDYLRISVTDRCNLNCVYCMPEKERENRAGDYMTDQEIFLAAEAMAELGVRHIRITGGEPLVRRDCWKLVGGLKALPGIETVTMTTNGVLLAKHLKKLKESGIDGLNISLDTRDRACYQKITGQDETETVEQAIRLACAMNIPVKINAVSYDFAQDRMGGNFLKDRKFKRHRSQLNQMTKRNRFPGAFRRHNSCNLRRSQHISLFHVLCFDLCQTFCAHPNASPGAGLSLRIWLSPHVHHSGVSLLVKMCKFSHFFPLTFLFQIHRLGKCKLDNSDKARLLPERQVPLPSPDHPPLPAEEQDQISFVLHT